MLRKKILKMSLTKDKKLIQIDKKCNEKKNKNSIIHN